jgi:hypothetical protein
MLYLFQGYLAVLRVPLAGGRNAEQNSVLLNGEQIVDAGGICAVKFANFFEWQLLAGERERKRKKKESYVHVTSIWVAINIPMEGSSGLVMIFPFNCP